MHLADEKADPKASPGVSIEIRVEERTAGEWPDAIQQDLDQIVRTDPVSGKTFILLRAACAWDASSGSYEPSWQFLNAGRTPLTGVSARRMNLERFWQYLPVFYLGALRDAEDEFSPRSQFWGRLLRAMEIPPQLEKRVQRVLDLLNRRLLRADPRLPRIADTMSGATQVAARDRDGGADLRLLPLKSWDLLSKAEIIMRNEPTWPWLPLQRHGQGLQSLSVIFLFQAFVEHLLKELYEPDSAPVLALEEPETHLHPQASRTLWARVKDLPGQKIITTHSPYFVQHVPFRDLRLVRLTDKGTEVKSLPPTFSASVPHVVDLDVVVAGSAGAIEYDRAAQLLTVYGKLEEQPYRSLLTCYGTHADRNAINATLRDLRDRSLLFISDSELQELETYARRIRGEIFFARKWLIVEGQSEYLLVHTLAQELGYGLDEHGVAVIDAQNNGNPATFAALARAFSIPWLAVFDGDSAGQQYCRSIEARDFEPAEVAARCRAHGAGDLEAQLVADGLDPELNVALQTMGLTKAAVSGKALLDLLHENKVKYVADLCKMLRGNAALAARMPESFRNAITDLRGLT